MQGHYDLPLLLFLYLSFVFSFPCDFVLLSCERVCCPRNFIRLVVSFPSFFLFQTLSTAALYSFGNETHPRSDYIFGLC